jgi:DNA invertase Pin-like site-specific DNA recombinase
MKCFLYARKSTDEDDKQLLSIEAQLTELREYVAKEKLCVVQEFVEKMTAKQPGRPIFNAMLKAVEKGQAQGIVAWHPDRLARNSVDGGRIIYLLDTGALQALKCPTFWFENTPQGKFVLNMAFGQSKYYVDNLAENIQRGIRQKIRLGWYPGKPPVGYLNEPRLRTIVIDEDRAPLVRRMFEEYATGNHSLPRLRQMTIEWGLRTTGGKPITPSKMSILISHPFYIGMFRLKGELFEGAHPPLISRDLFDRCQAVLKKSSHVQTSRKDGFAFRGVMVCDACGSAITAQQQKGHNYYHCTRKKGPCSPRAFLRDDDLADQLRQQTRLISISDDWEARMLAQVRKWKREESDHNTRRMDEQKARLAAVQGRLNRLLDVFLDGTISREDFTARKETLLQEKSALQAGLDLLSRNAAGWLEPLEQFIKDANQAEIIAISADLTVLRDFHRKIGSNLFVCSEKADADGREGVSRPTSEGDSEASEKEARHGGLAARAAKENPQILSENPSVLPGRPSPSRVPVRPSRRAGRRLWLPLSRVRVEFPEPWRSLAARSPKSKWCTILTIARTYFENKIHG